MSVRFSVVIPTRERPETLKSSLATCIDQDFDDYEIVVCDNGTSAATRRVVDEVASPRVRYIRPPRVLAMSDNWELAVSEARGEFVLVLGDDDGLMPFALRELDRILSRLGTRLVRWGAAFYTWPDIALPGQGDYLRLPMQRNLRTINARETIAAVARFEAPYVLLPMFYNAAIHRSLIDEVRRRAGRLIGNRYPDVYTGFTFGYVAEHYPSIDVPMTVAGLSAASNGIATLFTREATPINDEFRTLNEGARLPGHPWVPELPIFPEVPVADAFQFAKERLFPDDDSLRLDRRRLVANCLAAIPSGPDGASALAAIRKASADDPALTSWLEETLSAGIIAPRPAIRLRPERFGFDGESLHLDTARFGVKDIQQAVELAADILQVEDTEIEYATQGRAADWGNLMFVLESVRDRLMPAVHDAAAIGELEPNLAADHERAAGDAPVRPGTAWVSPAPPGEEQRLRSGSPRVSIVTPSFNQGRFLEQTIRSVLDQGYQNLEYIIIDGKSNDESVEIIRKYEDRLAYWVSEPDRGQADALNKGFARATGDILAWINSDDFYYPGAIASAVAAFASNPGLGLVYGRGNRVDETANTICEFAETRDFDLEALVHGVDYILQPTTFMRRQALHEAGPLDRDMHYAFDWDLWIRLGKRFPATMLDSLLAASREYAATKTLSGGFRRTEEIRRLVHRHTGDELSIGYLNYLLHTVLEALPASSSLADEDRLKAAVMNAAFFSQGLLSDEAWRQAGPDGRPTRREVRPYPDGWVGPEFQRRLAVPSEATVVCLSGVHDAFVARAAGPLTLWASLDGKPLGLGVVLAPGPFKICWMLPPAGSRHDDPADRSCDISIRTAGTVTPSLFGPFKDGRALAFRFVGLSAAIAPPPDAQIARHGDLTAAGEIQRMVIEQYHRGQYDDGWVGPELRLQRVLPPEASTVCLSGVHDAVVAGIACPLVLWASFDGHPLGPGVVLAPGPFKLCWVLPPDIVRHAAARDESHEISITTTTSMIPSWFGPSTDNRALAFRFVALNLLVEPPPDAQLAGRDVASAIDDIRKTVAQQIRFGRRHLRRLRGLAGRAGRRVMTTLGGGPR